MRKRFILAAGVALAVAAASSPSLGAAEADSASSELDSYTRDVDFSTTSFVVQGAGKAPAPPSEAELRDAETASRAIGEPLDALLDRTRGMSEFSARMTELEKKHPELVTRWGLPKRGEPGSNWVIGTTTAGDDLKAAVATLGTDTEIRLGAPAGIEETEVALAAAMSTLQKSGLIERQSSTYDLDSMHAVIQYQPTTGVEDAELAELLEAAVTAARALRGESFKPGELQFVEGVEIPESDPGTTVQGGRLLTLQSTGGGSCTSGFAADRSSNEGLITAQHCPNNLDYRTLSGVITFGSNADSLPNALIDLQFHRTTSGNDAGARFYATSQSDDRYVTSVANSGMSAPVCMWGAYSEHGCGEITGQAQCRTYPGGNTFCGQDISTPAGFVDGDSGGPWFYGNQARGFGATRGYYTSTGVVYENTFTRVGRADTSLHATIHQQ